jgi:hypothetical protein
MRWRPRSGSLDSGEFSARSIDLRKIWTLHELVEESFRFADLAGFRKGKTKPVSHGWKIGLDFEGVAIVLDCIVELTTLVSHPAQSRERIARTILACCDLRKEEGTLEIQTVGGKNTSNIVGGGSKDGLTSERLFQA